MKTSMKNLINTLFIMSVAIMLGQQQYTADLDKSVVNWKGFKPTGNHYGTVQIKNGSFSVKDKEIISGEFDIDMNTIIDLDMPAGSEHNTKLVNHLKSEDFFGVDKYPTANFTLQSTEKKGDRYLCTGDLTLKNITHSVSFLATIKNEGKTLSLKSETFKIDRSKWDIKFKSKSFFSNLGDNFIYDDIELSVEVHSQK